MTALPANPYPLTPSSGGFALRSELSDHVLQDAAVLEVVALLRRVDANACLELDRCARGRSRHDGHDLCGSAVQADDLETLLAGESE